MWSLLPELARLRLAVQLAGPLEAAGMTVEDFQRLWAKAHRSAARKPGSSPVGILTAMLAGPWRAELDAGDEVLRHNAARARGRSTGRAERLDGPYGAPAPATAADVAGDVLAKLRKA